MTPIRYPLAVIAPYVGQASETFIQRHMRDLAPGRTVVVATQDVRGAQASQPVAPTLLLSGVHPPLSRRVIGRVARGLGRPLDHRRAALEAFLRQHGVRVVLAEYLDQAWELLGICESLGIDLFAHAHGYDVSRRLRDSEWVGRYRDLGRARGLIAMSEDCKRRMLQLGLPQGRIHVIPYGVELPPLRDRVLQGREEVRCLAVGRMVGKKAPILLLDAFRRAHEHDARLRLDYVGGGDLFPAATHYVQAMGLESAVTLHGEVANETVLNLMGAAEVFLQHSVVDPVSGDEEGLPVAILEAMAYALPVVSTRHSGIPEQIEHGRNGFLVDEGAVDAMARSLAELAADAELRRQMGDAGRTIVEERFLWEHERAALLRVLGL